jgi:HEAT repeat protein
MPLSRDTQRRIERHIANLASPDSDIAIKAELRLIRFGSKAVDALIPATGNSNAQVRFRAVWALGKIADPHGFEAIARLTRDEDERVWYDAMHALAEFGDLRAVPVLADLSRYEGNEGEEFHRARVAALFLIFFGEAGIAALNELASTGDPHTRKRAKDALAHHAEGDDRSTLSADD